MSNAVIKLGAQDTVRYCPRCNGKLDALGQMAGKAAKNNELPLHKVITICSHCSVFLKFNEDQSLRLATDDDFRRVGPKLMTSLMDAVFVTSKMRMAQTLNIKLTQSKWERVDVPNGWRD